MRLNFSNARPELIEEGIKRLGRALMREFGCEAPGPEAWQGGVGGLQDRVTRQKPGFSEKPGFSISQSGT